MAYFSQSLGRPSPSMAYAPPGQVQWSLEPYYAAGATESKSVVLRSIPQDYFKPYSGYLTNLQGKWNPGLRHPTNPDLRLPGWIFSNKQEPQVRQLVQQIVSGQVAPMAAPAPTLIQQGQPNQFAMAMPGQPTMVPISTTGNQITPRMQTISVIRPIVGETLYLVTGGQRYPMIVQSVEETPNGYVKGATVRLGDQISAIKLNPNFEWEVPGYNVPHSIEL